MKLSELLSKYGDIEISEEQVQELKDKLGIKDSKAWEPKKGEGYYYIGYNGGIGYDVWSDSGYNKEMRAMGNCFKTEEEAEFKLERLKVIKELEDYAKEHNEWELDWEDCDQSKWDMGYDFDEHKIIYDYNSFIQRNDIYFTSEETAKRAVEAVGEVRVKKYYLEVEE